MDENLHIENLKKKFNRNTIPEYFIINNLKSIYSTLSILSLFLISIIIFPFIYSSSNFFFIFINYLAIGITAYKIQFIMHESSHNLLFSNRSINDIVGNFTCIIFGMSLKSYRDIHFKHHNYTNTSKDSQCEDYFCDTNDKLTKFQYIKFILSPLIFSKFYLFIQRELLNSFKKIFYIRSKDKKISNLKDYLYFSISILFNLMIPFYFYLYTNSIVSIVFYHLSLFTISLFLARIRTLSEHQFTLNELPYKEYSRSHETNLLENIFLYSMNFNYHLEHHICPTMPCSNLKKFSQNYRNIIHPNGKTIKSFMILSLFERFKNI